MIRPKEYGDYTATGIIWHKTFNEQRWKALGHFICRHYSENQWILGDWMRYGLDRQLPEQWITSVLAITRLSRSYIERVIRTVRRIPIENRDSRLSYLAHVHVSRLPRDQQKSWIQRAIKYGWTSKELHNALRAHARRKIQTASHTPPLAEATQVSPTSKWEAWKAHWKTLGMKTKDTYYTWMGEN